MNNKRMPFSLLVATACMLMANTTFAQCLVSGKAAVNFGTMGSAGQARCTGTGLCSIGGTSGVMGTWCTTLNSGGSFSAGFSFNIATAQQNGFITPTDCPSPGNCNYVITNGYTFQGNDGTGIPKGVTIPPGYVALYWPSCGAPGVGCIAFTVPYNGGNVTGKAKAMDKKAAMESMKATLTTIAAKGKAGKGK